MVGDTRNEGPSDRRFLAEIRWLLSKVGSQLGLRTDQAEEILHRTRGDHVVVVDSLMTFLHSALSEKLSRKSSGKVQPPTVGIYCPTPAYAEAMITLAEHVAPRHPCCLLTGDIENHLILNHPLGSYAGRDWIEKFDFFDVLIVSTLSFRLPGQAVKVLSFHDIFDSPLGDEHEFSQLAEEFDYILSPSKPATELLRGVFTRFSRTKPIRILPAGYIRLDRNIERIKALGPLVRDRVVYAPTIMADASWNAHCTAYHHAVNILRQLRETFPDDLVVFRPHPGSLNDERIKAAIQTVSGWDRITIDTNASDYLNHYARAKLLVTDMSGTAYTYAFSTERPVVFASPMEERIGDLGFGRHYWSNRETIGAIAAPITQVGAVAGSVARRADEYKAAIRRLRDEMIYNVGSSLPVVLNSLPLIAAGRSGPDWISITSAPQKKAQRSQPRKRQKSPNPIYRGHRIHRVMNRLVALDEAADQSVLASSKTLEAAARLDRAIIARTLDDLHNRIDRRIERLAQWNDMTAFASRIAAPAAQLADDRGQEGSADKAQKLSFDATPSVITAHHGFNIVKINNQYYACRQSLGPIDFSNENALAALQHERPADFFYAETIDRLRDRIEAGQTIATQTSPASDRRIAALETSLEAARQTIVEAESTASRAREEAEKAGAENARIRGEITMLGERLQAAESTAGNLRADLALNHQKLRAAEEVLAGSSERVTGLELDAAQKAQEISRLTATLETMRVRVATSDSRAFQAEAEMAEAHERIAVYEREASERAGRVLALEAVRGQMRLEIANLQNRLGEREREVGGHISVAESLREELAQMASELKGRESEMGQLRSLAGQSNFRITALEAQVSEANRILTQTAQELGRSRNEIAQLTEELEKSQAAGAEVSAAKNRIEQELAATRLLADAGKRLESELDSARREAESFKSAHAEALRLKDRIEQDLKAMSFQADDTKLLLLRVEADLAAAEASNRELLQEQSARDLALSQSESERLRLASELDAARGEVLAVKERTEREIKATHTHTDVIKTALSRTKVELSAAEVSRRELLQEAERQAMRSAELQKQLDRLNASILLRALRLLRRKLLN